MSWAIETGPGTTCRHEQARLRTGVPDSPPPLALPILFGRPRWFEDQPREEEEQCQERQARCGSPLVQIEAWEDGMNDRLLTPPEAARQLGVGLSTIYEWAAMRRIDSVKIGRLLRFRESALERFIRKHDRRAIDESVQ